MLLLVPCDEPAFMILHCSCSSDASSDAVGSFCQLRFLLRLAATCNSRSRPHLPAACVAAAAGLAAHEQVRMACCWTTLSTSLLALQCHDVNLALPLEKPQ